MSSRRFLRKSAISLAATLGLGGTAAFGQITLSGSTLQIGSRQIEASNALRGAYYDADANPPTGPFNSVAGIRGLEKQYIDNFFINQEADLKVNLDFDQDRAGWGGNPFFGLTAPPDLVNFFTNDSIAAVWSGEIVVDKAAAGTYRFDSASDDGTVGFIDGKLVLNNNFYQGRTRRNFTTNLSEGVHTILMAWYEGGGGANGTFWLYPEGTAQKIVNPASPPSGITFRKVNYTTDSSKNGQNVTVTANSGINIEQEQPVPFGTLTLGSNTLTFNGITTASFTGTTVGASPTFNIQTGRLETGPINTGGAASTIVKTGGAELAVNGSGANIAAGSTFNVQAGTLSVSSTGSPLGTSAITLSGGTLSVDTRLLPATPDSANGVGWSGLDTKANFDTALTGLTPIATRSLDSPIDLEINFPRGDGSLENGGTNDFGNEQIFNVDGANLDVPLRGNDEFVARFTGKVNVTTPGQTQFHLASNDGAAMFLDTDLGAGQNWVKVADNNRFTGTGGGDFQGFNAGGSIVAEAPAVNLTQAGQYDFAVGFFDANNNEGGIELYWTPAGGAPSIIPGASLTGVTGDFFRNAGAPLANAITVTANSTINAASPGAGVGAVTINPGVTLSTTGNDLTFANLTVGGTGPATLNVANRTTAQTINTPANGTLRKIGGGELVLSKLAPTTLGAGTSFDVGAGRLVATAGTGGDSLGDATVTLSGGTLAVQGDGTLPLVPTGAGLHGVTGKFYRDGLTFDQAFEMGRTDPGVFGWSAFGSVQAMDAKLNPLTPAFNNVPINVPLNFPGDPNDLVGGGNDDEGGNIFGQSGIGVNLGNAPDINFAVRFSGKLNVSQPGPAAFNIGSNSGAVMFLDLDTGPGVNWVKVVDNNRYGGAAGNYATRGTNQQGNPAIEQLPAQNLSAATYDFIVGFFGHNDEADGLPVPSNNEAGIEVRWTPAGGGQSMIPIAPSGSALNFGNNILVTENSTIDVGNSISAAFGDITINAGRTLTSQGGTRDGGLIVAGSVGGTGTLQASPNTMVQFTKNGAASTGGPTLDVKGAATMRFAPGSGNTFGGSAVATVTNDGLLHAASGITDLSGATVTSPNPQGSIIGGGIAGVTGRFYNTGLTFDQKFTAGRPDPAVNGWSVFGSVPAMDAALNPLTPAFNVPITTPLNFPGDITNLVNGGTDDDPGNIFAASGIGVDVGPAETTNFAVRFAGKLNVTQSGPTSFELLANDGAMMFLDLDTGPGTNWATVVDNNRFAGADGDNDVVLRGTGNPGNPPIAQIPAPNLTAGQYDFIVGFFNHNDNSVDGIPIGNNQAGLEVYWTPAGGGRSIIPAAQLAPPAAIQVDSGATLRLGAMVDPGTVNLAPTSRLELHRGTSKLAASALNIPGTPAAPTATLDMTDASLALDYPDGGPNPTADVRARIVAARGNTDLLGTWAGQGITSSLATADPGSVSVGFANNADLPLGPYTTFGGQPVDPTTVLIRGTRNADANLDGVVGDDDVTIVGATFGMTSGATWALGDFTYDGAVNDDDVTLLGALYDPSAPPLGGAPAAAPGVAAVPEPASWLMMALGGLGAGLFGWRRRRRSHS